jgi:hypothetical protein
VFVDPAVMRADTRIVTTCQVAVLAWYTDGSEQSMPQLPFACVDCSFDSSQVTTTSVFPAW